MGAATGVEGSTGPSSLKGSKTYRLDRSATETVQMLIPCVLPFRSPTGRVFCRASYAAGQVNVGGKVR